MQPKFKIAATNWDLSAFKGQEDELAKEAQSLRIKFTISNGVVSGCSSMLKDERDFINQMHTTLQQQSTTSISSDPYPEHSMESITNLETEQTNSSALFDLFSQQVIDHLDNFASSLDSKGLAYSNYTLDSSVFEFNNNPKSPLTQSKRDIIDDSHPPILSSFNTNPETVLDTASDDAISDIADDDLTVITDILNSTHDITNDFRPVTPSTNYSSPVQNETTFNKSKLFSKNTESSSISPNSVCSFKSVSKGKRKLTKQTETGTRSKRTKRVDYRKLNGGL
ncbi:hypothetical protein DID75_02605 [Candidatus Marinamargulisbacteria bacterium SCGC AG-410-N11]|nr:hypothetical protein DID75_02605 [Candidatus Marinamargulisbacteria bacterium SCGC AG-410-N11]